ncbi:MAG: trehalose-phosphatase [Candidatus Omnitrophica bacterium]|nr:trehalose-phosphatase [Candidatus Omnitrophota bacterium]
MEHLFAQWGQIRKKLAHRDLFVFLDFDGTLAPIAAAPEKAVILDETKDVLERLSAAPGCKVAIISGRALKDVKAKVGLPRIIYSGDHGLEVEGARLKYRAPVPAGLQAILRDIRDTLTDKLAPFKGVLVEYKGLSLAVHFRLADNKDIMRIKIVVHESVAEYLVKNKIKIKHGKMVIEVRPAGEQDKGKIVLWLLAREQHSAGTKKKFPIYIGDDTTDEDAFFALRTIGLTVFVGGSSPGPMQAHYSLKDPGEVRKFLTLLLDMQQEKEHG